MPLFVAELVEWLNVLLPAELTLRLTMELAEFLVVVELKPAAVCEACVRVCDAGSTLVTQCVTGSTK